MERRASSWDTSAAGPSMVWITSPDESCWATTITDRLPCSPDWTCTLSDRQAVDVGKPFSGFRLGAVPGHRAPHPLELAGSTRRRAVEPAELDRRCRIEHGEHGGANRVLHGLLVGGGHARHRDGRGVPRAVWVSKPGFGAAEA